MIDETRHGVRDVTVNVLAVLSPLCARARARIEQTIYALENSCLNISRRLLLQRRTHAAI